METVARGVVDAWFGGERGVEGSGKLRTGIRRS